MRFKIDAKTNYTLIQAPAGILNAEMAVSLRQEVRDLISQKELINFIVDLQLVASMEIDAGEQLLELHHSLYENGESLVFINLRDVVLQMMKKEQLHLSLNLSPTLVEAIDIISMETLERDILKEP